MTSSTLIKASFGFFRKAWHSLFLILVTLACIQSNEPAIAQCSLPKVPYATVSTWTACTATLTWGRVNGASHYSVKYKFKDATGWIKLSNVITDTFFVFTNLLPDTTYKFAVAVVCSNGSNSGYKNVQKKTSKATNPVNFTATDPMGVSIRLTWTPVCPVLQYNIRYRKTGTNTWTTINAATAGIQYTVNGLTPQTDYEFQIQAQTAKGTDGWSASIFKNSEVVPPPPPMPPPKPNFIIYMLDDGRYDNYAPNGGPSWFQSPTINRIAQEGINFLYSFPTTSLCAPSRVSIYTGLYAHKHGTIDNNTRRFYGLYHIQQILKDNGYYTGFIGKFGQFQGDPEGFDWWATSSGNIFMNPQYEINNKDTLITGHISDAYQDLSIRFLNSVPPGKKFLLMFFTRIPHLPTTPRPEDTNLYVGQQMPLPTNMSNYAYNFPSFFYNGGGHKWNKNAQQTDSIKRRDFQCLNGAERNMAALFNWLETRGLLDSTLILFTSDNGYLQGEHNLEAKQLMQEESIRVPLFVRLPAWFPPGTVSTVQTLNVDIPATILDAVGIPDTFGFDGESLFRLYNGQVQRKYIYYQFFGDSNTPQIRGVRSSQYKYVKHYCNQPTEEFYDLVNDPKENTNLINTASYASIINTYRQVLDSLRQALSDNIPPNSSCQLNNVLYSRDAQEELPGEGEPEEDFFTVRIYPNPASEQVHISYADPLREDFTLMVHKVTGEQLFAQRFTNSNTCQVRLETAQWASGTYVATLHKGGRWHKQLFHLQH
ncbi:MAG: sulfatase-like hydrolase/transferase [Chitinophagales bacterium]|nr:sulfatase-like hydrolase/transferase [Chitinophagales bacterium]MDW8393902.1 sulfatase-like hydrolase/transferase [Chitinophagales bacterium]